MIKKDENIQCGWCEGKDSAEKWNTYTYNQCKSREQRRAFTQIYKERTFTRAANTFYRCPLCGMWSRGSQLAIVDTDDIKLLKLGREPVIQEVEDNELIIRNKEVMEDNNMENSLNKEDYELVVGEIRGDTDEARELIKSMSTGRPNTDNNIENNLYKDGCEVVFAGLRGGKGNFRLNIDNK